MSQPVVASRKASVESCFLCGYEMYLSTDYQCPVVGFAEPINNAQLLERYGSTEIAECALGFLLGRTG